ncbi:hypothetical protein [Parapedobacter soli]|uniref:hypothetical protein n=1 Tax=Parapedobacter soli TaxID=416955 RepID=UPI0021CAAABA|nr:hypothetical protein [Parapedobacter soli]
MKLATVFFGYQEAQQAYQNLKVETLTMAVWGVALAFATVIIMLEVLKRYRMAYDSQTGRVDVKAFLSLIYPLILTQLVISGGPAIISAVEYVLSLMEKSLLSGLKGGEPEPIWDALKEEVVEKTSRSVMGLAAMEAAHFFDYIGVIIVKPIVSFIDHWLFGIAITGRYLYLILLEMVSPIAVICLLSKDTQQYFYTWVKHMIVCYLLVPAFMVAHLFAEGMKEYMVTDGGYTTFALIGMLVLKLYLYKIAGSRVFNLL